MLLDLTANNKGGHFDYFSKWSKSLEANIIDSKKLLLKNFFKILETDRLIIPSANIFDRHFLVYFIIVTLRYFLGKNQNFFIIHSIRRLKLFSFISQENLLNTFHFHQELQMRFPNMDLIQIKYSFRMLKSSILKVKS